MRPFLLCFFLFLPSPLWALTEFEVPARAITGAEHPIPLGEIVDLSVSDMVKKPEWLALVSYDWKVIDGGKEKRVRKVDNGIVFGSGLKNKQMLALCVVTYLFIVKDDKNLVTEVGTRTQFLSCEIVIGDDGPTPNPNPPDPGPSPPTPPTPTPEPEFEDVKYGLSKFVYRAVRVEIPTGDDRTKGAAALKSSFDSIRASIAAGALRDAETILKETAKSNNTALKNSGVNIAVWENFSKVLQERLYSLHKEKKLVTLDDYKVAWSEISAGFGAIKGKPSDLRTLRITNIIEPAPTPAKEKK